jgi:hypothetical protein
MKKLSFAVLLVGSLFAGMSLAETESKKDSSVTMTLIRPDDIKIPGHLSLIKLSFDVVNSNPDRSATVEATCTVHYDPKHTFLFHNDPLPPDTYTMLLKTRNGNPYMMPGHTRAFMSIRKHNGNIHDIQCQPTTVTVSTWKTFSFSRLFE